MPCQFWSWSLLNILGGKHKDSGGGVCLVTNAILQANLEWDSQDCFLDPTSPQAVGKMERGRVLGVLEQAVQMAQPQLRIFST